jgi:hypothetical protein
VTHTGNELRLVLAGYFELAVFFWISLNRRTFSIAIAA